MDLLFRAKDCLCRATARKWVPAALGGVFLLGVIFGLCFVRTPAVYGYHLTACERFVDRVCFSERNVFVIFLERTAGSLFLLVLVMACGLHPAALVLPPVLLLYRAYTFGGTVFILFSVYGFTGVLICLALFVPVHLLIDCALIFAASLSCTRALCISYTKEGFLELAADLLLLALAVTAVCLCEMILLAALFHPLGNVL